MLSAIVLAAGLSNRMGRPKLFLKLKGKSIIRWTVEAVLQAGGNQWKEVLVVMGPNWALVEEELKGLNVQTVFNHRFAEGMSTSLKAGLQSVSPTVEGTMIFLGDQPLISDEVVEHMFTAFRETGQPIVVPKYGTERGNPVLFAASQFSELMAVQGDKGGRDMIKRYPERVATVSFPASMAASDVDTWEDYEAISAFMDSNGFGVSDECRKVL